MATVQSKVASTSITTCRTGTYADQGTSDSQTGSSPPLSAFRVSLTAGPGLENSRDSPDSYPYIRIHGYNGDHERMVTHRT